MNKTELIEVLSTRLGDRKSATAALDAFVTEVQNAVTKGDKVSITGFGVFEKRERAARTARNPRTGEAVKVKKTSAPAFRPGTGFKELVASGKVAKVAPAQKSAPSKTVTAKAAPAKAAPVKTAPVKTAPVKTVAKAAPAKTATKAAPARATAKSTPAKATATKTTARPAATRPATKTAATKAPAKKAR
jgi:DNA-binding protein HU-beta